MKPSFAIIGHVNVTHKKTELNPTGLIDARHRHITVTAQSYPFRLIIVFLQLMMSPIVFGQIRSGTTVVVLVRRDNVIIAADSKSYRGNKMPDSTLFCKITPTRDFV